MELDQLQREYNRLCQRTWPSENTYFFQIERSDDGAPHVEFSDGNYHYIVTERGLELERRSTDDAREILFWMLKDLTFWEGVALEFKNRVEGRDCRRSIFPHQLELMRRADEQFAVRLENDIAETLKQNPYTDQA